MKLIRLDITGMTCAVCAGRIEKAALSAGCTHIDISITGNYAKVTYDENVINEKTVIDAIKKAGYGASISQNIIRQERKEFPWSLVLGAFVTVCLMYLSMGHMISLPVPSFIAKNHAFAALVQMVLALCAIIVFRKYFIVGFKNLIKLSPTMDSLIALGSSAAFIYSAVITVLLILKKNDSSHSHLYFESCAMILTLVSVGKTLEERAKRKTRSALSSLLSMAPESARVIRNGIEIEIPASELEIGDIAVVRTGDSAPADGILIEGEAIMDESSLTGESYGVEKITGSAICGATVCQSGYFKFRVEKAGRDTAFGKIITLVEDASASKAPVARLADKVASVFVPAVMAISLVTFVFWIIFGYVNTGNFDLSIALRCSLSVLVISCPCALGLATPTAVTCAVGKGASMGIFIKDAESIENANSIDTVVFDKTGTLTEGTLELIGVRTFGISKNEALEIASAVEQGSAHPVAKAIHSAYTKESTKEKSPLEIRDFKELSGRGCSAYVGEFHYVCANRRTMNEINAPIPEGGNDGYMKAYLAKGNQIVAEFSFFDTPRNDSRDAVKQLKKLKKDVIMLTGDNAFSAEKTASSVDIEKENVISGVLPDGKSDVIKKLQSGGKKVAMVGDGINDAPSLAIADVGIAMGGGRDAAIECADIVLLFSRASDVPMAFALFSKAYRIIKQNLFWALIYNAICIPIAAGVLYPFGILLSPMIGSAAMSCSSIFVVMNALRLTRFSYNNKNKKEN